MSKMSRGTFLKLGAAGIAASLVPVRTHGERSPIGSAVDGAFLKDLIVNNDRAVERYLSGGDRPGRSMYVRALSEEFAVHAASYCHPDSAFHAAAQVMARMDVVLTTLIGSQYPDGTLDAGGNRHSPPDTAFLTDHLCPAYSVLESEGSDVLRPLRERLRTFLGKLGEGLRTGGVHTPNHRWEVSAALARVYAITGDEGLVERIDAWLEEGIDITEDGNYSERSRVYAVVADRSLITIGRLLHRPALLASVRKNLEATMYFLEPNGDLVTVDSRRQDQYLVASVFPYYLFYRYLAIRDGDGTFAGVARQIAGLPEFGRRVLGQSLIFCMEDPLLLRPLPDAGDIATSFTKVFSGSALVRMRRGDRSATIFGGNDRPFIVGSGRSTNPTFFSYRKGGAILESMRLSTSFFNTGYVRSDGVQAIGDTFLLSERKEASYYQPLPPGRRDPRGEYPFAESTDGRFWSKMDFASRERTTFVLESAITIEEHQGGFDLHFTVDGPTEVEVTIELCFRAGGTLDGAIPAQEKDDHFLKDGMGRYRVGTDVIEFGPGMHTHADLRTMDGEEYATHFGTVKGKGVHVYVTGKVPFDHTITVR